MVKGAFDGITVLDFTQGFSLANREATHPFSKSITPPKSGGFADRNVDLKAEKDFATFGRTSVGVIGGVYNAFNWTSYGCLNNFIGPPPNADQLATLGQPILSITRCVSDQNYLVDATGHDLLH